MEKSDCKGENHRSSGEEKATAQCMIKSSLGNRKKMTAQFRWRLRLKRSNTKGFPGGASGRKNLPAKAGDVRCRFSPWLGKIPWRRKWQPTPVLLPEEFHGQRSLAGYSPWDRKESVTSEQLSHAQLRKPQGTCQEPKNEWPERYRRKTKRRWSPEAKGNEFSKKGITNWVQHDC